MIEKEFYLESTSPMGDSICLANNLQLEEIYMRCHLSHHKKVPRLRIFVDYELNHMDGAAIRNSEIMNSQQFENANSNMMSHNLKHSMFQAS